MPHAITAVVFCLLAVLSGAGLPAAAESQDDEKITAPPPTRQTPTPESVVIVPRPSETNPPGKTAPVETPVIPVVPVLPDKTAPVELPVIPVLPDKTTPVEIPVIPVLPQVPDRIAPAPRQEPSPHNEALVPPAASPKPEPPAALEPGKQASPLDFLVMPTPLAPDKAQHDPKAEKDKQPSKTRPEEPNTQPPPQAEQPKPGDPLRIPPDAAKTGDLAFLEGCWRGNPPEYHSKRIVAVRLCFDKNGIGRMTIEDPKDGQCIGAAKGQLSAQGLLHFTTEKAPCTRGSAYAPTSIKCEGVGNATVCFVGVKGAKQPQKIPFVRE